jgi:hypothetical protein
MLPPFLQKLQTIIASSPLSVSRWSDDGLRYDVLDEEAFGAVLREHYGASKESTFVRQLHYYGFRKVDAANGGGDGERGWSFMHGEFTRDTPEKILQIKRRAERHDPKSMIKPRRQQSSRVADLERQVASLKLTIQDLRAKLATKAEDEPSLGAKKRSRPSSKKAPSSARPPVAAPPGNAASRRDDDVCSLMEGDSLGDFAFDKRDPLDDFEFDVRSDTFEPLPVEPDYFGAASPQDAIPLATQAQLTQLLPFLLQLPAVQSALMAAPNLSPLVHHNSVHGAESWHCVQGAC